MQQRISRSYLVIASHGNLISKNSCVLLSMLINMVIYEKIRLTVSNQISAYLHICAKVVIRIVRQWFQFALLYLYALVRLIY